MAKFDNSTQIGEYLSVKANVGDTITVKTERLDEKVTVKVTELPDDNTFPTHVGDEFEVCTTTLDDERFLCWYARVVSIDEMSYDFDVYGVEVHEDENEYDDLKEITQIELVEEE